MNDKERNHGGTNSCVFGCRTYSDKLFSGANDYHFVWVFWYQFCPNPYEKQLVLEGKKQ